MIKKLSKKKSKKESDYKINIYAENLLYYLSSNEKSIEKQKILLTKLSNNLLDNQWIRIGSPIDKLLKNKTLQNEFKNEFKSDNLIDYKPNGLWFSKGEWLFHCIGCHIQDTISIITVDYSKIFTITNKKPNNYKIDNSYKRKLTKFKNQYRYILRDNEKNYELIKWNSIMDKYYGFAIYPYYTFKYDNKLLPFLSLFDVSSLILWNLDPIITFHNLGKISDYIKSFSSFTNREKLVNVNNTNFINKLIKKINKLNEKIL